MLSPDQGGDASAATASVSTPLSRALCVCSDGQMGRHLAATLQLPPPGRMRSHLPLVLLAMSQATATVQSKVWLRPA